MAIKITARRALKAATERGYEVMTREMYGDELGATFVHAPRPGRWSATDHSRPFDDLTHVLVCLGGNSGEMSTIVSREEFMGPNWSGPVVNEWPFQVALTRSVRIGVCRMLGLEVE